MTTLVAFVFSVRVVIAALALGLAWQFARRASRWPRRWLTSVVVFYWLAGTYAVPFQVSRWLVAPYHAFAASDMPAGAGKVAIVVLGAGEEFVPDWDGRFHPLSNRQGLARVAEAERVYRLVPDAQVISSGGLVDPIPGGDPSSVVMRDQLVLAGVPAERVVLESTSQTTHDEAVLIAPMLKSFGVDRVVLVTSDIHMRRSIGTFRSVGINPTPAAAHDAYAPLTWTSRFLPSQRGLELASAVAHDWVRGWWR